MHPSGMPTGRDSKAPLALALACALWGSAFLFAKVAFEELGPGHVLLYRFVLTAALLVPVVARGRVVPRRRDWPLFVLTGFLCVPGTMLIQFEGLARTSVTSASLLIGTGTPLLAMAALLVERERLGRHGWAAVLLSCVGIVVMVGRPGEDGAWIGNLLVFLSMVVATAWILLSRRIVRRYSPSVASAWILIIGTVTLIPLVLLREGTPPIALSHRAWGSLLVLAVACTVAAFLLWNWAVDRVPAGRAAPFLNLEPVVGAALGVAILGDPLGTATVMGGTLILAAAGLASLPERVPKPPPVEVPRRQPVTPAHGVDVVY
jgi:drug/metabolite transporter (DMT)-like permease